MKDVNFHIKKLNLMTDQYEWGTSKRRYMFNNKTCFVTEYKRDIRKVSDLDAAYTEAKFNSMTIEIRAVLRFNKHPHKKFWNNELKEYERNRLEYMDQN